MHINVNNYQRLSVDLGAEFVDDSFIAIGAAVGSAVAVLIAIITVCHIVYFKRKRLKPQNNE